MGLSVAVAFSSLTAWLETTAAGLLAVGSALFGAGAIANWRLSFAGALAPGMKVVHTRGRPRLE